MFSLQQLMQLYAEQSITKDIVLLVDSELNLLYTNESLYANMFAINFEGNGCISSLLYPEVYDDMNHAVNNGITQNICKISVCADKYFWVTINKFSVSDIDNRWIFAIYLSPPENINIIKPLIAKKVTQDKNQLIPSIINKYNHILTEKELSVLELLLAGYSQKLIVQKLDISRTVLNRRYDSIALKLFKNHLSSKDIRNKLLNYQV